MGGEWGFYYSPKKMSRGGTWIAEEKKLTLRVP